MQGDGQEHRYSFAARPVLQGHGGAYRRRESPLESSPCGTGEETVHYADRDAGKTDNRPPEADGRAEQVVPRVHGQVRQGGVGCQARQQRPAGEDEVRRLERQEQAQGTCQGRGVALNSACGCCGVLYIFD